MTVFKAFLKILNKNKGMVIFYTLLLVGISFLNFNSIESSRNFEQVKPKVHIRDNDNSELSKDFVSYINENSEIVEIKNYDDALDDAIFYRDISYYVSIPENYFNDLIEGKEPSLEIKKVNDYNATFAERFVSRYIRLVDFYKNQSSNQEELINLVNNNLKNTVDIQMTTNLDTIGLLKLSTYFDFANYAIIASLVFMISMILNSFNDPKIHNRITISSMNYKKHNRYLLFSNLLLSLVLFIIYVLGAYLVIGDTIITYHGLVCVINMGLFIICSTTFAILLGSLITNRNAIGGIINVIAIGTSFLCGAFVPQIYLPSSVLTIGHIFPSFYYIEANDLVQKIEYFNWDSLKPIVINNLIIIGFTIVFIVLTNIVIKKKRSR